MRYTTEYRYSGREDKPTYVVDKYGEEILSGTVLDVGTAKKRFEEHLPPDSKYVGIGIADEADIYVDLEDGELPFEDGEFDCVLCLDVLEHLDNIHDTFDELIRVSRGYIIIALPNPWAAFLGMLKNGYFDGPERPLKQYYLSPEEVEDRHKWFFGAHEAEHFIRKRAELNDADVVQIDQLSSFSSPSVERIVNFILSTVINSEVDPESLTKSTTWGLIRV